MSCPILHERPVRLGLNIDHVATLRNARGSARPDPIRAAQIAIEAGADGITAHLREDRRHIRDEDIRRLMAEVEAPLNLEMAATEEMTAIAVRARPHACCIVPERREEITTEGGLDAAGGRDALGPMVRRLLDAGIRVSLFIDPEPGQVEAAFQLRAPVVEFHTGQYCEAWLAAMPPRLGASLNGSRAPPGSLRSRISKFMLAMASTTRPPRTSLQCRKCAS